MPDIQTPLCPSSKGIKIRGYLYAGGGEHSHILADIICLYYDPFFSQILHPLTLFFYFSPHPMTPFFQNFGIKFQIFHAHFKKMSAEKGRFSLKFDKLYTE